MWRAYDNRLRRTVGLRILDASDPGCMRLHRAAIRARHTSPTVATPTCWTWWDPSPTGAGHHHRVAAVAGPARGVARADDPMLRRPRWPQAARAISSAHSQGVTHGRLRPATLMMSPTAACDYVVTAWTPACTGWSPTWSRLLRTSTASGRCSTAA